MSAKEAIKVRAVFDKAISETKDPERVAKLELLREWYTNPKFRTALSDLSFAMTKKAA
jgi:hypothetical protein